MLKSILANPIVQFLVGRTIGGYLLIVGATTRWTRVNAAVAEPLWSGPGRVIVCIWHGRFTLTQKLWKMGRGAPPIKILISQSREGDLVSHTARAVGADVVRGSAAKAKSKKPKGGVEAMLAMARHLKAGGAMALTPDGPRGPRMQAREGPVTLAKLTPAPLLPVAWSTTNRLVFDKSWDHFILPLPFGRGALVWGELIAPPPPGARAEQIEAVRLKLEAELNRVSAEADRLASVKAIEPAPRETEPARDPEPAPT